MGVSHLTRYVKNIAIAVILALVLTTYCSPIIVIKGSSVAEKNHPQPGIWEYKNVKNQPGQALIVTLQHEQWQAATAACMAPAFFHRTSSTPLFYDDGAELQEIAIQHNTKAVTDFGSDAVSATAGIATTYWSKAEIVVITDTYEHVLWLVPTASFLATPILINPASATLTGLGTKCAIVLGASEPSLDEVIVLKSKEEVWQFQLELFDTKGQNCNYVVMTNPHDTDEPLDANIEYPYMSLAAVPLAAYRNALIQTGDYTADKNSLDQIHKRTFKDDVLYDQVKPYFEKVKADSYKAENFLVDSGHTPQFISLVGGPFALPDFYYDIHTQYLYWSQEVHYVPSHSPYASLEENVSYNLTVKEDLGIGRIVGHSILDATNQLTRTFFYREFLPGGSFVNLTASGWEVKAVLVDGHRLNQPRNGGPPHTSCTVPFHPAGEVEAEFNANNFTADYIVPKNKTDPYDTNPSKSEILNTIQDYSMIQLIGHGGSMANPSSMWMEGGYDIASDEEVGKHKIEPQDIMELNLAPGITYVIACHTGHIFLDMEKGDLLPLAFVHAGAVSYIAPVTCQSICFWDQAPEGVAATQCIFFWQKLLESNKAVGIALAEAKWEAYNEWKIDGDDREEPDNPAFHLFGDPAFEPYKTNVSYDSREDMDIDVSYGDVKAGKKLDVNVVITSLSTGQDLDRPQVFISFNGDVKSGSSNSFVVPEKEGDYTIEVEVQKAGYNDITARYIIQVKDTEVEGDTALLLVLFLIVIIVVSVAVILLKLKRKSKRA